MADRRPDDTPLAPRRSLSGRTKSDEEASSGTAKRPVSERVAAAVSGSSRGTRSEESSRTDGSATVSGTPSRPKRPEKETASKPSAPTNRPPRPRGSRKARLRLTHVDPWSVMKTAFLLSIAFGVVTVVAVALVWSVLDSAGVWESINRTVQDVLGSESAGTFDIETYVGTSRVIGFTLIVAVVDVVLITAVATLSAFLYNLAAALLGGIEVTLAEDER
ncbi:MAG TPA: DUF3566 domain-containing protein [Nocardioidaceae bacterium]|nr:DUF3566 domain-containing protein [Nocardioidaceae bacterium]